MGHVLNFCIGTIIGFIIYVLITSMSRLMTIDMEFNEKNQKIFIINFISGLCLLSLAMTAFNDKGKLKNKSVKNGLLISGLCLSLNTIIINWHLLSEHTRIMLIGICLGIVIWYAYYNEHDLNDNMRKKKKKKKNKH